MTYVIESNYPGGNYGWEEVGEYDDINEARRDLAEYRMASPQCSHRLRVQRSDEEEDA